MYTDLLDSAEILANIDDRRPKQANLRRAISNAYYGVFHYLIDASCKSIMRGQHSDKAYRHLLSRAFQHNEMSRCCKSFQNGTGSLPVIIVKTIPNFVVTDSIAAMARTFIELQQLRENADYDLSSQFLKTEVIGRIQLVRQVVKQFDELPLDNSKRLFLSCLWSWDRIKGR